MSYGSIRNRIISFTLAAALAACGGGEGSSGEGGGPTFTPKFAYVASTNSDRILGYTIDAATGVISPMAFEFLAGDAPASIAVHPNGRFLYAANSGSNDVSGYSILDNGLLLPVPNSPVLAGTKPQSVAIDPSGKFLYVANFGSTLSTDLRGISAYSIDAATGALTEISGSPFTFLRLRAIAVEPSGRFAYALTLTGVQALAIDAGTGALTTVGSQVASGTTPVSLTIDPTGKFAYVVNSGSGTISGFTIDTASGALTRFNTDPNPSIGDIHDPDARSLAMDPSGRFVFVVDVIAFLPGTVSFYTVDVGSGALIIKSGLPHTGVTPSSACVDRSGKFLYVTNSGSNDISIFTIDAGTGVATEVGTGRVPAGNGPSAIGIVGTTQ